ncbi:hypothetical protein OS493_031594 [Desmophyllum pertusum]|uniref:TRAF-type domain-containing protein n=1 Tax=Desmophyllum pertusum TaxID=174260 RepID=A0A9W9YJT6_9CNID|nr:hypothetical protein OS493_031594 [Desmophyllum pertusum]
MWSPILQALLGTVPMKGTQECPIDRHPLDPRLTGEIYPDLAIERTILDMKVKCPNDKNWLSVDWRTPVVFRNILNTVRDTHAVVHRSVVKTAYPEKRMSECPIDRGALSPDSAGDIFPDKASERKILDYQVQCSNESVGCQWIGELRNVEAHEVSCLFVRVICTNDNCSVNVLRNDLQRHLNEVCPRRIIPCHYCGTHYVWCLAEEHFNNCSVFPVPALRDAVKFNIPRREVNTHLDEMCGVTEVDCKYAYVGCQVKVPRNALERHLQVDIETHLNLACEKLQILENESIITDQRLEELERFATSHHHLEELHTAISDKMKRIDELERSMRKTSQLQIRDK